jgi:hypothetical protein
VRGNEAAGISDLRNDWKPSTSIGNRSGGNVASILERRGLKIVRDLELASGR